MIEYYELGAEKRLNEIVMAGSHDAGITGGIWNVKTQELDILAQATAGVRVFDLRVAGVATKVGKEKMVELKTYHGPLSKKTVTLSAYGLQGGKQTMIQSKVTGAFGEGLLKILRQAKTFVTNYPNEFLILKFDKSKNWPQIAAMIMQELNTDPNPVLYKDAGNVNKKTLFELRGKVIVVFTADGYNEIDPTLRDTGGILRIKSLKDGEGYQSDFNGIQYVGKGGTGLTTRKGKSLMENYNKQLGLMQAGAKGNPNVLGMMYWTITGVAGSIYSRDKMLWKDKHVSDLQKLWVNGMGDAVKERLPTMVDPNSYVGGVILKRFLPNIVMVDFAETRRCQIIYNLNKAIPQHLTRYEQLAMKLREHFAGV